MQTGTERETILPFRSRLVFWRVNLILTHPSARLPSVLHHVPVSLILLHELKGVVDLFQGHFLGHQFINQYLSVHVLIHQARELCAALTAAEGGAGEDTA